LKLVFVGPTYPCRGGIARYGTFLLAHLQSRHECLGVGFERLYPAFLFPGQSQSDPGPLSRRGARGEALLHYGKLETWRQAALKIEAFHPEGVIITWWVSFWALHTGWLARRLKPSCPIVFLCHNVLPHEAKFFDAALTRWALRPGDGFIVHSQEESDRLTRLLPQARIRRREHPVFPLETMSPSSQDEARARLGISGRMLLFFGFVRSYKGLDVAIEALALLGSDFSDLSLWVAGEFWDDVNRYRRLVQDFHLENRVHIEPEFLPEEAMALRLAACDGVVLPYRSATGSGVLGSAYAAGRPVIATRTGCFREMVIPGQTGILCEPGNAASLAQAIREFYEGEGPRRFQAGVAQASQKYSWEGISGAVEELLHGR
jgi:glycosyltransferase involved in cell wall biosynthesis